MKGTILKSTDTVAEAKPGEITLDTPFVRGDQTITTVTIRKPAAGELRGVKLVDLLQMDVAALTVVLPRVTTPALTAQDVARLDPADLVQLGSAVSDFLLPKAARADLSPTA
jgi:hypothetical protein